MHIHPHASQQDFYWNYIEFLNGLVQKSYIYTYMYIYIFVFLGPHMQHMEVPRLGVQLELQPLVYATATATPDLSRVCDLHHSSWQPWIFNPNPLSETRDRTRNLMVPSRIHFSCTVRGSLEVIFLERCIYKFILVVVRVLQRNRTNRIYVQGRERRREIQVVGYAIVGPARTKYIGDQRRAADTAAEV